MDCHNFNFNKIKSIFKKTSKGFSLVEVVVVIAIFGILFSVSDSVYTNMKSKNNMKIATDSIVQGLRYAQSNAQAVKNDSKWGLKILPQEIVVFKGSDYLGRDIASDQSLEFSNEVIASGIDEIIFEKMTGFTLNTGTVTLTNNSETKNISINEKGTITY